MHIHHLAQPPVIRLPKIGALFVYLPEYPLFFLLEFQVSFLETFFGHIASHASREILDFAQPEGVTTPVTTAFGK